MKQPDLTLHLLFFAVLLALGGIRIWYWQRQAAVLGMRFAESQRTLNDLRQLGALLTVVLVGIHIIHPSLFAWSEFRLPVVLRWAGGALAVVATGLSLEAARDEIVALRAMAAGRFAPSGLFAWLRHPLEVVIALLAVALTLLSANWLIALLGAALAAHGILVRAPRADRERRARAGAEYEAYARATRPFLPLGRSPATTTGTNDEEG